MAMVSSLCETSMSAIGSTHTSCEIQLSSIVVAVKHSHWGRFSTTLREKSIQVAHTSTHTLERNLFQQLHQPKQSCQRRQPDERVHVEFMTTYWRQWVECLIVNCLPTCLATASKRKTHVNESQAKLKRMSFPLCLKS